MVNKKNYHNVVYIYKKSIQQSDDRGQQVLERLGSASPVGGGPNFVGDLGIVEVEVYEVAASTCIRILLFVVAVGIVKRSRHHLSRVGDAQGPDLNHLDEESFDLLIGDFFALEQLLQESSGKQFHEVWCHLVFVGVHHHDGDHPISILRIGRLADREGEDHLEVFLFCMVGRIDSLIVATHRLTHGLISSQYVLVAASTDHVEENTIDTTHVGTTVVFVLIRSWCCNARAGGRHRYESFQLAVRRMGRESHTILLFADEKGRQRKISVLNQFCCHMESGFVKEEDFESGAGVPHLHPAILASALSLQSRFVEGPLFRNNLN